MTPAALDLAALFPFFAAQIIVGLRYPQPRWFLGTGNVPPPLNSFVIVGTDFVIVDVSDNVIAPSP